VNETMAHAPQSPAGETRANRFARPISSKTRARRPIGVSMFCAPQQRFPCFFRLINRGTGTYPSCTAPTNFGRITGGYQAKEQADYPILWRKRPKKIEPAAPKFGA